MLVQQHSTSLQHYYLGKNKKGFKTDANIASLPKTEYAARV